ncbi:hypothetical protein HELRODRAFT_174822 [Helobdella robusta]|uniref:Hemerythrin-like domain-containing protein n=1 Tax=Helobdella robusta TaxID=6412 RepID=T1F8I7_HELRO|nr:hypothetical protein HELRODRAFT_174822 [Helobdella robusta]ESO01274.1 hypothetical protein HELRODRAFT_174822 [Helobdella robusta]
MKVLVILVACVAASLAYPIPDPFQWDESFRYDKLDEQHKKLFTGIADVQSNPADGAAISHLEDLFYKHFRFEEKMMEEVGYANLPAHKRMHTDFESEIKDIHTPVQGYQIFFMKDWLVNHIKGIDFQYKGKLSS